MVRNKKNHFREMPEGLQRAMGPVPEGYYRWGGGEEGGGLWACAAAAGAYAAGATGSPAWWSICALQVQQHNLSSCILSPPSPGTSSPASPTC